MIKQFDEIIGIFATIWSLKYHVDSGLCGEVGNDNVHPDCYLIETLELQ